MRSDKDAVVSKLSQDYKQEIEDSDLGDYIPWPEEAIIAYSVYNYTEQLDQSLVQFLRDELGQWWSDHMHHIDGGMSKLPEKFYDYLRDDITFNVAVNEIDYKCTEAEMAVTVKKGSILLQADRVNLLEMLLLLLHLCTSSDR